MCGRGHVTAICMHRPNIFLHAHSTIHYHSVLYHQTAARTQTTRIMHAGYMDGEATAAHEPAIMDRRKTGRHGGSSGSSDYSAEYMAAVVVGDIDVHGTAAAAAAVYANAHAGGDVAACDAAAAAATAAAGATGSTQGDMSDALSPTQRLLVKHLSQATVEDRAFAQNFLRDSLDCPLDH